jgi:hypothetical protein
MLSLIASVRLQEFMVLEVWKLDYPGARELSRDAPANPQ